MADRQLKVKIGIDLGGLQADASAAAKAFEDIGKAAQKAGDASSSAAQRAAASVTAASDSQVAASRRVVDTTTTATTEESTATESMAERIAAARARLAQSVADNSARQSEAAQSAGVAEVEATQTRVDAALKADADEVQSSEDAHDKMVSGAKRAGAAIGAAIAAGAVIAAKAIVDLGREYEQNLNVLQAVSKSTDAQMQQVSATAMQLGNDLSLPGASASDAAQGMTELAKGGLSVDQSMKAARGTMELMTAAQVSGADAAQIQANALNAFSLSGDQAGHVADVLANTANAASGSITDLAAALSQSGGIAASFGISLDDTATALGLFAKNGMLGSDAGTSMKTALTSLASPTKQQAAALDVLNVKAFDAQGNFVGLKTLTGELETASKNLTQQQFDQATSTAFGTDAMRTAVFLAKEGTTNWDAMATAVGHAGGAQELAAAQSKGVNGAINNIQNALSTTALTIYQKFSPAIADMANNVASKIPGIGDFFMGALTGVSSFIAGVANIPAPLIAAGVALGAVVLLKGPFIAAFTAMGTAVKVAGEKMAVQAALAQMSMASSFERMTGTAAVANISRFSAALAVAGSSAAAFGKSMLAAIGGIPGLAIIAGVAMIALAGEIGHIRTQTHDFASALDEVSGKIDVLKAQTIVSDGTLKSMQDAGVAAGDYTAALSGNQGAIDRVSAAINAHIAASKGDQAEFITATGLAAQFAADMDHVKDAQDNATASARESGAAMSQVFQDTDKSNAVANFQALSKGIGGVAAAADLATPAQNHLWASIKEYQAAADTAAASTDYLTLSMQLLAGKNIDTETAVRANSAALRDIGASARATADANQAVTDKTDALTKAQQKFGAGSSEAAAAQRDLRNAQDAVKASTEAEGAAQDKAAQSAFQMTDIAYRNALAHGTMKDAISAATTVMQLQRDQFVRSAIDAGMTQQAAEDLATAEGLIPANVTTTYETKNIEETKAQLAALKLSITSIPGTKDIQININGKFNPVASTVVNTLGLGFLFGKHAAGGYITGGIPGMDSVPALLMPGELVIPTMVASAGPVAVANFASAQHMATGGIVGGNGYSQSITHNVYNAPTGQMSWSQSAPVQKFFPVTIVNQGTPLTADDFRRIQREAERLDV